MNGKPGKWNRPLAGLFLLSGALLLLAPASFLCDGAYFSLLPLFACAGLLLSGKLHPAPLLAKAARGRALAALLFTGLFFLMLSAGELLRCPLFSEEGLCGIWWRFRWMRLAYLLWNWTGYLISLLLSAFLCLLYLLDRFTVSRPAAAAPACRSRLWSWLGPLLPLAVACGGCIFSSTPSLMVGDAGTVWSWARDGLWSAWHTEGYLLFVRLCYLLSGSQRMATLLQGAAYLSAQAYALAFFRRQGVSTRGQYAYVAVSLLAFLPIYFLQAILKDVLFSTALLAFGLGLLAMVNRPRLSLWTCLFTGFFGLVTLLTRQAGILPVAVGGMGAAVYFAVKKRKALYGVLATGAGIALSGFLLVNVLCYRTLQMERNPSTLAYSAPMAMIGAVADSGVELSPEDREVMERVMPVEKWAACYNPYFSDPISRDYGAIGADIYKVETQHLGPELLKLNARFLFRYPGVYLEAFFNLNSLIWEIATPTDGYVRTYLTYPESSLNRLIVESGYAPEGTDPVTREFKQPEDSSFTALAPFVNRYAEFLCGVPILRSVCCRGGFSLFLCLFAGWVLVKKKRARDLIGLAPLFAVIFGMLFSMPAQEIRYVFPSLLYGALFPVYAWFVPTVSPSGKER